MTPFDMDEWEDHFVARTELTRREAQVVVRYREDWDVPDIEEDLGISSDEIEAHYQTACDKLEDALRSYLLLFGPPEFHENTEEYPEQREKMKQALDVDAGW